MHEIELNFRLAVDDAPDGSRVTFRLKDQFLNYAFSDQLKDALKALTRERIERGVPVYVMDLSAVQVMDSCGLSVLIGVRKLVEESGKRMVVIAPSQIILRLFAITRLDRVFEVVTSAAECEAALSGPQKRPITAEIAAASA
ncbi:MAG: hypothetical protein HMLKMBBP_02091 [Planctomycetes bacterium]|nr:hypothetical protein [Planctomycetota bacterium]